MMAKIVHQIFHQVLSAAKNGKKIGDNFNGFRLMINGTDLTRT